MLVLGAKNRQTMPRVFGVHVSVKQRHGPFLGRSYARILAANRIAARIGRHPPVGSAGPRLSSIVLNNASRSNGFGRALTPNLDSRAWCSCNDWIAAEQTIIGTGRVS